MRASYRVILLANRNVDLRRVYFSRRLTLGGEGWVDSSSVIVRWSALAVRQFVALTGHANDGSDGRPLAPTMEMPF